MQITRKRHFTVAPSLKSPVEFKFLNRLGGWDALQFSKYHVTDLKVVPTTFSTRYGTSVSFIKPDTAITYYSVLLTQDQYYWLFDLSLSPRVVVDGRLMNVMPGSFKYDNISDFYELEITVSPAVDEKYLKM